MQKSQKTPHQQLLSATSKCSKGKSHIYEQYCHMYNISLPNNAQTEYSGLKFNVDVMLWCKRFKRLSWHHWATGEVYILPTRSFHHVFFLFFFLQRNFYHEEQFNMCIAFYSFFGGIWHNIEEILQCCDTVAWITGREQFTSWVASARCRDRMAQAASEDVSVWARLFCL